MSTQPNVAELKEIFREGWSDERRVAGWTAGSLSGEFGDPACRGEWKATLALAVAGIPVGSAIDIGTGPGTIAQFWAELGFATIGLDFSPGMLAAGREAADARGLAIDFVLGDAEMPALPPESFDVVSSRFVLFTLPNPGYALRRWVRLLRPGGALVLIGHELTTTDEDRNPQKPRSSGWNASEEYQAALRQLPFTDHKASHLQVVMEAAGLGEIHQVPMEDVLNAREGYMQRSDSPGMRQARPYIIVGRKTGER